MHAFMAELEVPEYILEYTQELEDDDFHTPSDQLCLLGARLASMTHAFRTGSKTDQELAELAHALERDLISWSARLRSPGFSCSFLEVRDADSSYTWNGTRHEYSDPRAVLVWNRWRCHRILLSRMQEAIWRRSWPMLVQPMSPMHNSEYYKSIKSRMAADICIACAREIRNDSPDETPSGSVSKSYQMITPLSMAGSCLLEELAEPITTPGGRRMIVVDRPLHLDLFNRASTQLAWVIERMDYIANKVGITWAAAMSQFLKGESKVMYDLSTSYD